MMNHATPTDGSYEPLPEEVLDLCKRVGVPPRLLAHLILVHDVARTLANRVQAAFPTLKFDKDAVVFGAATHDLGKATHREELSEPGKLHELRGVELLKEHGVHENLARFAYTHGNWKGSHPVEIEDLMVALADNCWKGKRVPDLEGSMTDVLAEKSGEPQWKCYVALDDILQDLGADADARIEWQRSFPVH
jgi:putative nucleotidyltransferase with HDIG domain